MKFTQQQQEIIKGLEKQIHTNFSKIKSGDRSVLNSGKLFEIEHLSALPKEDFYAVRKHLKESLVHLNKNLDTSKDLNQTKDLMLKMTLYDQMKYDVKLLETKIFTTEKSL